MKLPISARLLCCAAQVPAGARVADVGADHGYLGIELLRSGRASFVHASELRAGPLSRAMANAARFGVAERMRFSQADGLQAVEAMREQPFPIVVMDVKMPNMDGIAALKIIVEQWPTAQVILLSGHADMQLAVQAMSEGAFGYLMKPVDFDELLFKIEDAAMQSRLEGPESDMAR